MKKILIASLIMLLTSFSAVGCGNTASEEKENNSPEVQENKIIQIKGSDTMVYLSQALAEEFMKRNPGAQLAVKGGGSGIGITALIDGTADIANSSRKMKEEEKAEAETKGINPVEYVIALDGLAIIAHPDNPVEGLTLAQIKDIYTGKIKNWKELGGKDQPIRLISREANSGTYAYFREFVLKDEEYGSNAEFLATSKIIAETVAQDSTAIGYVGEAYARDKVKKIKIAKEPGQQYLDPTEENIIKGLYPISRPLQVYTAGEATGVIKDFVDFMLSADGQQIVREIGYTTINK
ncbi:MAG: phosphate ABC transporter substrate-binding protein [Clostridia bacterium]|nr:phosphate ABC transporter substrate-binding protein [Clostridia bacterium]